VADYELTKSGSTIGDYISYPGATLADKFLALTNGDVTGTDKYPKVDMSLFDQATMCATCHVGGAFYEHDRKGVRLPVRLKADLDAGIVNTVTGTVWEEYDATYGFDKSYGTYAPWLYPVFAGNDPSKPYMAPLGWGNAAWNGKLGAQNQYNPPMTTGQLMMPNVKEMDCLFCHFTGYDNIAGSVMTQAGNLSFAPSAGAGFMDMMPISPNYMGYNGNPGSPLTFTNMSGNPMVFGQNVSFVSISADALNKINAKPLTNNCSLCHATKTLKNLPEMFGTTGGSNGFMSSAPMVYDPTHGNGPLGKRMVSYDLNGQFIFSGSTPVINGGNYMSYLMAPDMQYVQAMGVTPYNATSMTAGVIGGGNPLATGPLYFSWDQASSQNQNVQKLNVGTFARAEWFKRGDAWQPGQDVHGGLGCAGCHFTGETDKKNQCDPGRGHDAMSGIEDSLPAFRNGQPVADGLNHDTRNTVKRCEFCHITGKDYFGQPIETFGAPNPASSHSTYGLTANTVQTVKSYTASGAAGGFGGQGIAQNTDFTSDNTKLSIGNHLDVMDCTVCHVQKKSMVVRMLDATSGNRYPVVLGTDPSKGMFGMFQDPGNDAMNAGVVQQYTQMFGAVNTYFGLTAADTAPAGIKQTSPACTNVIAMIGQFGLLDVFNAPPPNGAGGQCSALSQFPQEHFTMMGHPELSASDFTAPAFMVAPPADAHVVGGQLQEWKPLLVWQKNGNMDLPLEGQASGLPFPSKNGSGMEFRRKLYLANPIVAALWNNVSETVDANGDTAVGGILNNSKASLVGYKDIFTNQDLNKNNTQGFGEPIFDPWIMRDLKAGMNFGPSAMSVIPVGFGGATYASAFNPADGKFTGAFKYVSIWSGAITLTEPEEIHAYLVNRGANWVGTGAGTANPAPKTQLSYVGDPFTVTHGVKAVNTYVLGKNCADCHASNKEIFNGGFTMTGAAIPADHTYDPTSYLKYNPTSGDYYRMPGIGLGSPSGFMERPLEPFRIKALKGELRTAYEGFNKLGQPRSSEFQGEYTAPDGTEYTFTKDLERSHVLYPVETVAMDNTGGEKKIYYKISDCDVASDGKITPKTGAVALNGQEYADYMETGVNTAMASYGIGVNPVAKLQSPIADADSTQTGIQVATGTALSVKAEFAQPNAGKTADIGTVTYAWTTSDAIAAIANPSSRTAATFTFSTTGTKTITLTVTDEEGKVSSTYVTVYAVVPPIAIAWVDNAGNLGGTINVSNLLPTTNYVKIYFGDGAYVTKTITVGATTASQTRTYATAGSKQIQVYAYNSAQKQISYMQQSITVNGAN
jgi:hypothetical protein